MTTMPSTRIDAKFAALRDQGRAAFVAFITAGDPDLKTSEEILMGLPAAGADIIELGMPFTDPMADGPAVQLSSQRALNAGHTMADTFALVTKFREQDQDTPIVLMGYYNPIYFMGVDNFLAQATAAGVDGLIVVDLPPEEDQELCLPAQAAGLNFIRLATPTTDDRRLPAVLQNTSGFVYYVTITGITGTSTAQTADVQSNVDRIKAQTDLPLAAGFGIKTTADVAKFAQVADAVVVGSSIVDAVKTSLDADEKATASTASDVLNLVKELSAGVRP